MTSQINVDVDCLLVGEYVDEGEPPTKPVSQRGEVVRSRIVANYLDVGGKDVGIREFTVLLKDGGVVAVRGHGLKHWPPTVTGESGSYGVVVRTGSEEVLIALFKILDVVGIFHGELRSDRKIA